LVVPLPALDPITGNLPPGVHDGTWEEIHAAFGWSEHRKRLLEGMQQALQQLRSANCRRAYIDGSFVTAKEDPADFDGCWEPQGVDPRSLDPVLLDFGRGRVAQKAKYGGELFIAGALASSAGTVFLDFFQTDKSTGQKRGIVAIDLGGLP
jgi:hypothetical protein